MKLDAGERIYLRGVQTKMGRLRDVLAKGVPDLSDVRAAYSWLVEIKTVLGNLNNDVSFVGALMAKEFLARRHQFEAFDVSRKAQGAPGLDIDETTLDGHRVIAEIKTTIPYAGKKLGAQQEAMFRKDFAKLAAAKARFKYFFVTEENAFDESLRKYESELEGITLVLLPTGIDDDRFVKPI